ncbi:MAG: shikimate dehydrogenase [Nitrospiraceae bacterium]|nr:shikimate dehydrogenase [Nitrospiraceae bacterium]
MKITSGTRLLALFGYPVGHSLSPNMHNAAFQEMGLDYCYVALPVAPEALADAVRAIRALNLRGVNITVPHKENVIPHLDEVDGEAAFIGAVNTIVNNEGRLKGYNTDGRGFMQSLSEEGIDVSGKNVLVVGAGGASRAVSYYLSGKAGALSIFDVDRGKLERLVSDLGRIRKNVSAARDGRIDGADVIVNATPLGLKESDPLPVDVQGLGPQMAAVDLIYKETPFLRAAAKAGVKTMNGLGMLLWQGVFAFELWTGKRPPHELMRNELLKGFAGKAEKGKKS